MAKRNQQDVDNDVETLDPEELVEDQDVDGGDEETLLDIAIDEIPDLVLLEEGTEALLRIVGARLKRSQGKGEPMIAVSYETLELPGEDIDPATVKVFTEYIMLGSPEDSASRKQEKRFRLKQLARAFSLPYSETQIDVADFPGGEGWAIVGLNPAKDGFEESNSVRRYINPR